MVMYMISFQALAYQNNVLSIFKTLKWRYQFNLEHPNYFHPDGLIVFVGPQGSGKTLSAVNYVRNLIEKYPNALIVTNLELKFLPKNYKNLREFRNADDFFKYKNGEEGIIYLIDEIQLYFNSLQSKNINLEVINYISQQRKQRVHIVGTSQVFGRMAKPLREQFDTVILCKKYFNCIEKMMIIDRDSIDDDNSTSTNLNAKVKRSKWGIYSPEMFDTYDTYKVIDGQNFAYGEEVVNNAIRFTNSC